MIKIQREADVNVQLLLDRRGADEADVSQAVEEIVAAVRAGGDEALLEYSQRFDGVQPASLRVSAEEIEAARSQVGEEFLAVLEEAAENIRNFHRRQVRQGFVAAERPGIVMGQRILPLATVGVYVPGGTAPYPSTVLMDVIPAQIAGVPNIVMTTPPDKSGGINAAILAAASIAGVTEIYKVGGAQAVAALAYGTQTIPRADKIVGPGNIYVATAKRMVYGAVDIDMIAGPSDILVVADATANPAYVAADMLGQAEHDENAAAVLVSCDEALAKAVQQALATQIETLERKEIAKKSLARNGHIIVADNIEQAMALANQFAPEHLELCVDDPFAQLPRVQNAGSVFLGHYTPEALGDYFAGPNHTLPTGGTARFYSPLSVDDFVKKSSYLYFSQEALERTSDKVIAFARKEGLTAHAQSVVVRTKNER